ncbi:MAG TPA: glycosyltransferase family 4 protein [Patescibacteria group bacterium]|nr:glycosyltransferase family 4 protein [Patescibacteria group bacterium]
MKKINKRLHIVFLDLDDVKNPILNGGQARATYEVGGRLVEKGHKVTVLCSKYPGYKDRFENGIYYKHIGIGTGNIKVNNFAYLAAAPLAVTSLKNVDVILECFTAPVSTLLSPLFTNIPVVGLSTSFEADRFSKMYHLPFYLVERFGLRFYKYFVALTIFFEKKMKVSNPKVISTVIPEGVGEEFFKIKKKRSKHILFLGRLDMDQKGIDLLLHAYAKIANKVKYPLVIAGNGPDEKKVAELIKKLKLENKVSMVGPTYGDKKAAYLSESLFVAFPSRNETFSCFALEALASQLPLVAFDIPGISWTGDNVASKAKAFNVNEYASLLLDAVKKNQNGKLGKEARRYAAKFTWSRVASEFEEFFYMVLKKEASYAK